MVQLDLLFVNVLALVYVFLGFTLLVMMVQLILKGCRRCSQICNNRRLEQQRRQWAEELAPLQSILANVPAQGTNRYCNVNYLKAIGPFPSPLLNVNNDVGQMLIIYSNLNMNPEDYPSMDPTPNIPSTRDNPPALPPRNIVCTPPALPPRPLNLVLSTAPADRPSTSSSCCTPPPSYAKVMNLDTLPTYEEATQTSEASSDSDSLESEDESLIYDYIPSPRMSD